MSPCPICGELGKLVRDHDHATGLIRGRVCDLCNSWLSIYERNQKRIKYGSKPHGGKSYQQWASRFAAEIAKHLSVSTDEYYSHKERLRHQQPPLAERGVLGRSPNEIASPKRSTRFPKQFVGSFD